LQDGRTFVTDDGNSLLRYVCSRVPLAVVSAKRFGSPGSVSLACRRPAGLRPLPRRLCPWRSGTTSPRGHGIVDPRFHLRRWMMLFEGNGLYPGHPNLHGYVRFFNLDTGAFVRVHVPL
ncbi:hypothetical protein BAE44_0020596, partial [Dichanthelium oligosanthes]